MNTNAQNLPPEVLETIINFASEPEDEEDEEDWDFDPEFEEDEGDLPEGVEVLSREDMELIISKTTLFRCALVSKTWLWPARRRLQSLLDLKHVFIFSTGILAFSNLFGSPLCTLDSGLIQTLTIQLHKDTPDGVTIPFFALLSTLDRISLPSIHTISIHDASPDFSANNNNNLLSPRSTKIQSAIKTLEFCNPRPESSEFRLRRNFVPFKSITRAASLFPSLETLIVQRSSLDRRRGEELGLSRPPPLLRKLDVDALSFLYIMDWLAASEFNISNIVSLSIDENFSQREEQLVLDRLPRALDLLRPNLQECELCTSLPSVFD